MFDNQSGSMTAPPVNSNHFIAGTTTKPHLPQFLSDSALSNGITGATNGFGSTGDYILFYSDWDKYPRAIVDTKTSNKSAILLAAKLKKKGIKNHAFFLALLDPTLQGVDPYSPDLTLDQMRRIGVEVRNNPWYFYREIAKAPARSGSTPDPVEFNRANVALWWSFYNHVTFFLTQPRQTGKSFSTDLLMTHLMGFMPFLMFQRTAVCANSPVFGTCFKSERKKYSPVCGSSAGVKPVPSLYLRMAMPSLPPFATSLPYSWLSMERQISSPWPPPKYSLVSRPSVIDSIIWPTKKP